MVTPARTIEMPYKPGLAHIISPVRPVHRRWRPPHQTSCSQGTCPEGTVAEVRPGLARDCGQPFWCFQRSAVLGAHACLAGQASSRNGIDLTAGPDTASIWEETSSTWTRR
jgi:hypothetical protein